MKHWPVKPLGNFVARKSGSVDPSKFPDEIFDLYSIPAFDTGEPQVCAGREIGSAKQVVQSRDVLLSRIVPHIRRAWVVGASHGRRLIASGEWIVFRSPELYPLFLRYFLIGDPFHAQFMQTVSGVGGSLLRAKASEVAKITIPVPPLAEQERIVKLLDEADALRKLRAQANRRTAALLPALFDELFGDPGANPMKWPVRPAGGLMLSCEYGTSQKANEENRGITVLRMGNVTTTGDLDLQSLKTVELTQAELDKQLLQPGDVLFNRTNSRDLVGKTGMWDGRCEAVAASYFIRVRFNPDVEHPQHFTSFMNHPFMKRRLMEMARGAVGQANINAQELKAIPIPVPPLAIQQTFARRVAEIRELEAAQAASRRRLDALFHSLLHRAFSGEL
jgi:type I restriction enzyme S subunit